jgi:hypothetical protein
MVLTYAPACGLHADWHSAATARTTSGQLQLRCLKALMLAYLCADDQARFTAAGAVRLMCHATQGSKAAGQHAQRRKCAVQALSCNTNRCGPDVTICMARLIW